MRRSVIAMAIVVVAALAGAAGASAKTTKPVLTLSEELGGGVFRPLEPGDPYFARAEAGFAEDGPGFGGLRERFYYGCHSGGSTTYFGKVESNGEQKDKIVLEGVTGAYNGETACETNFASAPEWGEVTITVSGFPWEVTLGPWPTGESTAKSGSIAGTPILTMHSSVVGSCVYSGKFAKLKSSRAAHDKELPYQDWWLEAVKLKLTQGTCPKKGSILLGTMESLGPGETPIHLSVG